MFTPPFVFTIIHEYTEVKQQRKVIVNGRVKMEEWGRLGKEASALHVSSTSSSVAPANRITQTDTPVIVKVLQIGMGDYQCDGYIVTSLTPITESM